MAGRARVSRMREIISCDQLDLKFCGMTAKKIRNQRAPTEESVNTLSMVVLIVYINTETSAKRCYKKVQIH